MRTAALKEHLKSGYKNIYLDNKKEKNVHMACVMLNPGFKVL